MLAVQPFPGTNSFTDDALSSESASQLVSPEGDLWPEAPAGFHSLAEVDSPPKRSVKEFMTRPPSQVNDSTTLQIARPRRSFTESLSEKIV